jgi:hypothetical protein
MVTNSSFFFWKGELAEVSPPVGVRCLVFEHGKLIWSAAFLQVGEDSRAERS